MENKVIIDLDEYLRIRDNLTAMTEKIEKLGKSVTVKHDEGYVIEPSDIRGMGMSYFVRDIYVPEEVLEEFINDLLGLSGYDLKIIPRKDKENK